MAGTPFTIYTDQTVDVSAVVTANGRFTVDTTPIFNNTGGYNSISLHVFYGDLLPDPEAPGETVNPGWNIRTVLESSDTEGNWFPIGQQFEPIRILSQGPQNIITVQPNIFNINEGVPIDIWDGVNTATRISRQQGILGTDYRVSTTVHETRYGTVDALQSFKVKMFGVRYNS